LIVRLKLSAWDGEKLEQQAKGQVESANGARSGTVRSVKTDLLPGSTGAERDMVWTCLGEARTFHYQNTLRWMNRGEALVTTLHFMNVYMPRMNAFKARAEAAHATFTQAFPTRMVEAAPLRAGLYHAKDYPTVGELDRRFVFDTVPYPVPSSNALSALLGGEVASRLDTDIEDAMKDSMKDAYERLHEVVGHMAATLKDPKKGFKNTLLSNVERACEILPALNVAGDSTLDAFVAEVKAMLGDLSVDDLRDKDGYARNAVAQQATDISNRLGAFAL
jgi:hypothetical protein